MNIRSFSLAAYPVDDEVSFAGTSCNKWTSIPLDLDALLGRLDFGTVGTADYALPDEVPGAAKEVLLYVNTEVGYSGPADAVTHIKFFTSEGRREYAYYLGVHSYGNAAWNTNSVNIWLPITQERMVHVTISHKHSGNIFGMMGVIGYC